MRLFAAVRPPLAVLDHLAQSLGALGWPDRVGWPGAGPLGPGDMRWTARQNWHLTIAFYGEVPDGAVEELESELAAVVGGTQPFGLHLRGAGVFAHRTLWIGAGGDLPVMADLCTRAADAGVAVTGFRDDRVRSRPHLTIGRQLPRPRRRREQEGPDPADALARALAVYQGPSFPVDDVVLVRSRPGRGPGGGPLYDDVARYRLGGR